MIVNEGNPRHGHPGDYAPDLTPAPRFAMMYRCPACQGAMSTKIKKSVEVVPGVRTHPGCVTAYFNAVNAQRKEREKREAL